MDAMRAAGDHVRFPEVDHGISGHLQAPAGTSVSVRRIADQCRTNREFSDVI